VPLLSLSCLYALACMYVEFSFEGVGGCSWTRILCRFCGQDCSWGSRPPSDFVGAPVRGRASILCVNEPEQKPCSVPVPIFVGRQKG